MEIACIITSIKGKANPNESFMDIKYADMVVY